MYPPEDNNVFYMLLVTAWSLASNISGDKDSGYSLYIDITYTDDTNLWGQIIQVRQTKDECKMFLFSFSSQLAPMDGKWDQLL